MILRTERLLLRPFRADDVDALAAFDDAEAYRRHLSAAHPTAAQLVATSLDTDGAWVIELEGRVVGSVFLGEELACLLDPAVHGRGIGPEAARAVIEDAFARRGYEVVVAHADPANTPSLRAIARLGFVRQDERTHHLSRSRWIDAPRHDGRG